jgi:prepilin signal peptidase PulO-like enzyme (type II secretory pathway)
MVLVLIFLAGLGAAFGSFAGVLAWRIHKKKDWVHGRSQCDHCKHQLAAKDLVPIFSWLALHGKCRYCKKPISWQLPAIELFAALVFAASYAFWPGGLHGAGAWVLFITWLVTLTSLLALLIYDIRWMLLPSKIIYPTAAIAATGRFIYLVGFESDKGHALVQWVFSLAVASGVFWVLFVISKGKWIGFGDIRLGFITGTILASPEKSFLMIFLGSVLGTLYVLPALIKGKSTVDTKLPYGPFLILGCIIALLFGNDIINWYKEVFIP